MSGVAERPSRGRRATGWQFTPAASFAREVTARLFGGALGWFMHGPQVSGREHVADLEEPAIICPTHESHLDVSAVRLALGSAHRRRLAPAAAADYFGKSRLRWFFAAWLGSFPFVRAASRDSIDMAEALLADGWSVILFPEGTRSRSGEHGTFRPGVGLLAHRSGRPVLPVRIVGTHEVLPPGTWFPRRGPVEIRFGPPLVARPDEDARAFVARLEAAIRGL
jgi:1-acyl-sn-glycerol-3-phosphate acyltransferase